MIRIQGRRLAGAVILLVVTGSTASAATYDPWAKGSQWMSVRAGYAKLAGAYAANAGAGYGFGYSRMLTGKYAVGLYAHHELLTHAGSSSEMAFPFTLELTRHFDWHTEMRPYLGFGGGGFNYRTHRAGQDAIRSSTGYYVVGGTNVRLNPRQLLGLDARLAVLDGLPNQPNPVFGRQQERIYPVGIKLNWSFCY